MSQSQDFEKTRKIRSIQVITVGFADFLMPLEWKRDMSLSQFLAAAKMLRYGKTDCALPMNWAIEQGIYVDVFIVLTDNDVSIKSVSFLPSCELRKIRLNKIEKFL